MNRMPWLAAPSVGLLVAAACGSTAPPDSIVGGSGSGSGAHGGSGSAAAQSGAVSASGQASGATTGNASDAGSGVGASGTMGDASADDASTPSDGSGGSGDGGNPTSTFPHGGSMGCGRVPIGATSTAFANYSITIPTCSAGLTYPDCIDPHFAPSFTPVSASSYVKANGEDPNSRDYDIELPANYDPNTPYPIFFGGSGCSYTPPQRGDGFGVGETGAIKVGLSAFNGCFSDGGTSCAGSVANEPNCKMGPELPYFRAVLAQVESKFCVDRGRVFVGGYSSGAWEAFTLGCGGANLIRGIVTLEGGWRINQPPCTGPMAALMVAGGIDTTNPIGPLAMNAPYVVNGSTLMTAVQVNGTIASLDSNGSAPGRDAILQRNGCIGTATAPYDPKYPDCVQYTGCPPAYPVVWCPVPACGHICSTDNGVNYSPGSVQGDPLMWNFLSKLPAVN